MRKLLVIGSIALALLIIYIRIPCNSNTVYVWPFPKNPHSSIIFSVEPLVSNALNSHQACAVESAARHHLHSKVNVFMFSSAPVVDSFSLSHSLSNINLIQTSYDEIFARTPLEQLYQREAKQKGRYLATYISDSIRFLLVWKFGGIYLDTDVIALKNMQYFKNFVIKDSDPWTTASVFGFQKNHPFLSLCIEFIESIYKVNNYDKDGKAAITGALKNYCKVESFKNVKENYCNINTLPSSVLFPISSDRWSDYFDRSKWPYMQQRMEDSYAIYINKNQSREVRILLGSGTALEEAMRSNCPLVYDQLARNSRYISI